MGDKESTFMLEFQNLYTKVIDGYAQIAVLASQVSELKKVIEDRRDDTKELFARYDKVDKALTDSLVSIRKEEEARQSNTDERLILVQNKLAKATGGMFVLNWVITTGLAIGMLVITMFMMK